MWRRVTPAPRNLARNTQRSYRDALALDAYLYRDESTQQVGSGRVSKRMRADSLCGQSRLMRNLLPLRSTISLCPVD